jgi:hypothetical protein
LIEHELSGKPVSTPDQVEGSLFRIMLWSTIFLLCSTRSSSNGLKEQRSFGLVSNVGPHFGTGKACGTAPCALLRHAMELSWS